MTTDTKRESQSLRDAAMAALDSVMDFRHTQNGMVRGGPYITKESAIEALRAALAAPEQAAEPVAAVAGGVFLCRAWGETDLPSAELVADWSGVRRFMVREWLGSEDAEDYDGTVTLDRLKADFDEHEEDKRGGPYTIKFEIGGVSIERVCGFAPAATPPSAAQGEGAIPAGWVPLRLEWEPGYPEDVAFGPPRMMERLKKWLDKHFAALTAATPPSAAQGEGATQQPIETIRYWLDAYSDPASGPHFMGHGMVVVLLREYLAMRIAAQAEGVDEAAEYCGLSFSQAKSNILALPLPDVQGLAISLLIQNRMLLKHGGFPALTAATEKPEAAQAVAWMHPVMGACFSAAQWSVMGSKDPVAREFRPLVWMHQATEKPQQAAQLEPVQGDVLPAIGSRVFIRHGRDDDAHACTVTGYYVWPDLKGNKWLHRVFVRLVYEGTDAPQARMLCDCWPTAEAALASPSTQQAPAAQAEQARLLTDEQIDDCIDSCSASGWGHRHNEVLLIARAIERACAEACARAAIEADRARRTQQAED